MAYDATHEQAEKDEKVLGALQEVFQDERHWIKGTSAKNSEGKPVSPGSDDVCQVCLSGGIAHMSIDHSQNERLAALVKECLPGKYRSRGIAGFNDAHKTVIDDVRAVLAAAKVHVRHFNGH